MAENSTQPNPTQPTVSSARFYQLACGAIIETRTDPYKAAHNIISFHAHLHSLSDVIAWVALPGQNPITAVDGMGVGGGVRNGGSRCGNREEVCERWLEMMGNW